MLVNRESEPTWDVDIGEDVKAECSKFGQVQHVFVDKNSKVHQTFSSPLLLCWALSSGTFG